MKLHALDYFLWFLKLALEAAVLWYIHRQHKDQVALRNFLWFSCVRTIALLFCHFFGDYTAYWWVYWCSQPVELFLAGALVHAIFMQVFAPLASLPKSTVPLMLNVTMGILFLVIFLNMYNPANRFAFNGEGFYVEWMYLNRTTERAFTTVISLVLLAIVSLAGFFSLPWRHQSFGIATGLTLLYAVNLARHSAISSIGFPSSTWRVSSLAYLICLAVWLYHLRRPPRSALTPSPQMVKFMFDLLPSSTRTQGPGEHNDTRRIRHAATHP